MEIEKKAESIHLDGEDMVVVITPDKPEDVDPLLLLLGESSIEYFEREMEDEEGGESPEAKSMDMWPELAARLDRIEAHLVSHPPLAANLPKSDGLAVKSLREQDGGVVVGGYLLLWGTPVHKDMGGDFFVKGQTQLWLDRYPKAPTLFHHGLDDAVGLDVIGHRIKAVPDDTGVWVESWIDKSNKYWAMVAPLLEQERLFYSPGSAKHLVKRAPTGELKSFPVIEDTLTPVPMQHRLLPVAQIKAAYAALDLDEPDLDIKAASEGQPPSPAPARAGRDEIDSMRAYISAFEAGLELSTSD